MGIFLGKSNCLTLSQFRIPVHRDETIVFGNKQTNIAIYEIEQRTKKLATII